MKSSREIYIDYKRAREAAEELEEIAEKTEKLANGSLRNIGAELSSGWKCDAASVFLEKQEQTGAGIRQTAAGIRGIARDIRAEAYRYYMEEMRAIEILSDGV